MLHDIQMTKLSIFLLMLLGCIGAKAQYTGTYSIKADGSGDFATLQAATDSLEKHGITDTVILKLGSGYYPNTAVSLDHLMLQGSQHLIIRGDTTQFTLLDHTNTSSFEVDYVLRLLNVSGIHFQYLVFLRSNAFASTAKIIDLDDSVHRVAFTQCGFYNGNTYGEAIYTSARKGALIFDSCGFTGGGVHVAFHSDSGAVVSNCIMQDFTVSAITAAFSHVSLQYNSMEITNASLTGRNGIFLDNSHGMANGNKIILPYDGVGIAGRHIPKGRALTLTNNYVNVTSIGKSCMALLLDSTAGSAIVVNNTLRGTGETQAKTTALVSVANSFSSSATQFISNAIINQATHIVFSTDTSGSRSSQNNAYYNRDSSKTFQLKGSSSTMALSAWQSATSLEGNSITGLPKFDSTGYRWAGNLLLNKGLSTSTIYNLIGEDIDRQTRDSLVDIGAWEGTFDSSVTDTTNMDTSTHFVRLYGLGAGAQKKCDADSFVIEYSVRTSAGDTLPSVPVTIRIKSDSGTYTIYDTLSSAVPSDTLHGRLVFKPGGKLMGAYQVSVFSDTALTYDTLRTAIIFFGTPVVQARADDTVKCAGEAFQLTSTVIGGGKTTIVWQLPNGKKETGEKLTYKPDTSFRDGIVVLAAIGEGGCIGYDTLRLTRRGGVNGIFTLIAATPTDSGFDVALTANDTTTATYSWTIDGVQDSLTGRRVTLLLDSGMHEFTLTVTDSFGCSASSTQKYYQKITSISPVGNGPSLTIYPNPISSGEAWIVSLGNLSGLAQVSLWNVNGQQVWAGNASLGQATVPSAGLQSGIYLLRVQDNRGVSTARVMLR